MAPRAWRLSAAIVRHAGRAPGMSCFGSMCAQVGGPAIGAGAGIEHGRGHMNRARTRVPGRAVRVG